MNRWHGSSAHDGTDLSVDLGDVDGAEVRIRVGTVDVLIDVDTAEEMARALQHAASEALGR